MPPIITTTTQTTPSTPMIPFRIFVMLPTKVSLPSPTGFTPLCALSDPGVTIVVAASILNGFLI